MTRKFRDTKITDYILPLGIILFLMAYIFRPNLGTYSRTFVLTGAILTFILFFLKKKIIFKKTIALNIFLLLLGIIGLLYSNDLEEAVPFMIQQTVFCILFILLCQFKRWQHVFILFFNFLLFFFFIGFLIQLVNPYLLTNINSVLLPPAYFQIFKGFLTIDVLIGFTWQSAISGYLISSILSISLINIVNSTIKTRRIFFMFLYLFNYYLLLLTDKRGFILFNIIILIIITFIFMREKFKSILSIVIVLGIVYTIFINTEAGYRIIERTVASSDFTTGREELYVILWEDFLKKPLFGNGTFSTLKAVFPYNNGHNIYLQVLRELGLLGFIPFIIFLGINLLQNLKLITVNEKSDIVNFNERYYLGFSLCIQLLFILWGFTGNPLYDEYPLVIYYVAVAMVNNTNIKSQ